VEGFQILDPKDPALGGDGNDSDSDEEIGQPGLPPQPQPFYQNRVFQ